MTRDRDWMMWAKHLPALHLSLASARALVVGTNSRASFKKRTDKMESFQSLQLSLPLKVRRT